MDFDLDDFEEDVLKETSTNKNVILILTTPIPQRTHWPYDKYFATKRTSGSSRSLATNLDFAGNTFPITEMNNIVTTTPAEPITNSVVSSSTVSRDRTKAVSTNLDFETNTHDEDVRTTPSPTTTSPTQYTQTNRFDLHPRTDSTTQAILISNITEPSINVGQDEQTTASTPDSDIPMNDSPNEPNQADSTVSTVATVMTESETPTTKPPIALNPEDNQSHVSVDQEEKSTSQSPNELNQVDNSELPTQIDSNSTDNSDTQSSDDNIQVSSASQPPVDMNQAENSETGSPTLAGQFDNSPTQTPETSQAENTEPQPSIDMNEEADKSDNINQTQTCQNVNGEIIEKQCNEAVTQSSTITIASESSESQPPGELNAIINTDTQSINESDNEKTNTQEISTISEAPIDPNDANIVELHQIDEQTSTSTSISTDSHVTDAATLLEKENQPTAGNTVPITTQLPPSLSDSIGGTNELIGDKTTSAEHDLIKDIDENASSSKLSSINVIVPLFLLVLISFKFN